MATGVIHLRLPMADGNHVRGNQQIRPSHSIDVH
jgi:hypothetical protein